MKRRIQQLVSGLAVLAATAGGVAAAPLDLAPPPGDGPVPVRVQFDLNDINHIDDTAETFEFSGVLTLEWNDPRQAFDPAVTGREEQVFTGNYQFNELAPAWYPQVFLINEASLFEKSAVSLRTRADGSSTLTETINAVAEAEFDMRRFPFDRQRLDLSFAVLGFGRDEVVFELADGAERLRLETVGIPQWTMLGAEGRVSERSMTAAGPLGIASTFVVGIDVAREPWYARRLIGIPLICIVLLSFSVFWMDRSSIGDRLSVSFIGILTGVTYQMLSADQLPHISYFTLIHGFLGWSFMTMCATVVVNLVVSSLDRRGELHRGDLIDRRCRVAFPLVYFTVLAALTIWQIWAS